jgi:hypothetical protein
VDGGCTRQDDKEKLIVWERDVGKRRICVMDVDDEEVMLEEVLQDLKGSLVSNVNQTLFILGRQEDVHVITGMLHWTREVRGLLGDWDTYQKLSCDSYWTQGASLGTRVTSRDVDNAEWWLGSYTTC